jgi:flagellin-like hook-associated protein FlgL
LPDRVSRIFRLFLLDYSPDDPNYRPRFGRDVSVSADGNTFTASATDFINWGIGDGYVKTFSWDGSSWTETPNALRGKDRIDFGRSVEMAANGESILVFAPSADAWAQGASEGQILSGAGQAYVFNTEDGEWSQLGEAFSGGLGASASYTGGVYNAHDAAISASGTRAAIFTKGQNYNSPDYLSNVSIFDWNGRSWNRTFEIESPAFRTDAHGAFDLSANGLVLSVTSGDDILTFDLPSQPAQSSQGADLANAGVFLTSIDEKMKTVEEQRAEYGTMQNRLQYTISNLMSISEQTTIARSRIEDADFATESAALAKTQVLQQSGAAMLAQANARPQLVLQLIK